AYNTLLHLLCQLLLKQARQQHHIEPATVERRYGQHIHNSQGERNDCNNKQYELETDKASLFQQYDDAHRAGNLLGSLRAIPLEYGANCRTQALEGQFRKLGYQPPGNYWRRPRGTDHRVFSGSDAKVANWLVGL